MCSEIPRRVRPADWRPLMPPTRAVAFRLVARGLVDVMQKGQVVLDLSNIKGPIRLRLSPEADPAD